MPTTKRVAVMLIALLTINSANPSQAGCFDWLWGPPRTVNYAPTTVGYFPGGVYENAGPAASYYTTNYAPAYAPTRVMRPDYNTVYRAPRNGHYTAPTTTFYRAPRTTYYRAPTTTYYRAATQPSWYAPRNEYTTYYAPTTVYQPVRPRRSWFGNWFRWGTACDGQAPCRPYTATTANYAPRTNFRPVWQRVPVTYYRPITTVDPVTGQTVQRMQPCTTYRWQIQQRPALLPQRRAPIMQDGVICEPTPAARDNADDPYYNRSRIIRPGEGGLIPKDAEIPRDERVPADDRPRLRGTPEEPDEMGALPRRGNARRTASTRRPADNPTAVENAKPGMMLDPNGDDRFPEPPVLLSPKDKTAMRTEVIHRVAYQAQWPATKPTVRRNERSASTDTIQPARPTTRRQPTRPLDDSGWRSLRD